MNSREILLHIGITKEIYCNSCDSFHKKSYEIELENKEFESVCPFCYSSSLLDYSDYLEFRDIEYFDFTVKELQKERLQFKKDTNTFKQLTKIVFYCFLFTTIICIPIALCFIKKDLDKYFLLKKGYTNRYKIKYGVD